MYEYCSLVIWYQMIWRRTLFINENCSESKYMKITVSYIHNQPYNLHKFLCVWLNWWSFTKYTSLIVSIKCTCVTWITIKVVLMSVLLFWVVYALVVNKIILQSDIKQQQNKINKTRSYKGQLIAVVKLSPLCFYEYIYFFLLSSYK